MGSSSKQEKREKKGRKEQRGGQDKDNQPAVGSSKPSPQMASPPSQTSPLLWQHVAPCPPVWPTPCPVGSRLAITIHTHAPIMNEYSVRDLQAFTSSSVRVG